MKTVLNSARTQYATFEVAGHHLGIRVLEVQEVLRHQQVTPVPLAPAVIAGLINVRGQIIPALDMRRLLLFHERGELDESLSVVLQTDSGPVCLQVDQIGDVVEIESASLESPPPTLEPGLKRCLGGVCQMKDSLLLVLDTGRIVDVSAAFTSNPSEIN